MMGFIVALSIELAVIAVIIGFGWIVHTVYKCITETSEHRQFHKETHGDRQPSPGDHGGTTPNPDPPAVRAAIAATPRDTDAAGDASDSRAGARTSLETLPGSDKAPDYSTYLTANRAWSVRDDGQLMAVAQRHVKWPARKPITAICVTGGRGPHDPTEAPQMDCTCGIYATTEIANVQQGGGPNFVWGTVALWGKVCEYTAGYRAQYAYPLDVKVWNSRGDKKEAERIARRIQAKYGIPARAATAEEYAVELTYATLRGGPITAPPRPTTGPQWIMGTSGASFTPPPGNIYSPGAQWIDPSSGRVHHWNGTSWQPTGTSMITNTNAIGYTSGATGQTYSSYAQYSTAAQQAVQAQLQGFNAATKAKTTAEKLQELRQQGLDAAMVENPELKRRAAEFGKWLEKRPDQTHLLDAAADVKTIKDRTNEAFRLFLAYERIVRPDPKDLLILPEEPDE